MQVIESGLAVNVSIIKVVSRSKKAASVTTRSGARETHGLFEVKELSGCGVEAENQEHPGRK